MGHLFCILRVMLFLTTRGRNIVKKCTIVLNQETSDTNKHLLLLKSELCCICWFLLDANAKRLN